MTEAEILRKEKAELFVQIDILRTETQRLLWIIDDLKKQLNEIKIKQRSS